MPATVRTGAAVGLEAIAAGTAWARVEAQRHYIDDVLVGYAIGHFVAAFVHDAFIEQRWKELQSVPADGGGRSLASCAPVQFGPARAPVPVMQGFTRRRSLP